VNWFAGRIWKSLEKKGRENLESKSKASWVILVRAQKTRMLTDRNVDSGGQAQKVSDGNEDLGITLETILVTYWQRICLYFVHVLIF
jgi:hypothetical protein